MTDFTTIPKSFTWVALATLALTASPASAATVYGVRMKGQGTIECQTLKSYKPTETGGNSSLYSACHVTEETQYVTASIGKMFGCSYNIVGSPDGAPVTMEHRFIIPNPGVVNTTTGEHFLVLNRFRNYTIDSSEHFAGWHPDHAGEIVAGDWTIEIRYEGRLMASCLMHVST